MDILLISLIIGAAFFLQSIFGFFQVRNFVKEFHAMCKKGKVLIGKNPKKIRAGSLILLSIDDNAVIKKAKMMQGVTVFARFKEIKTLKNRSLPILASSHEEMRKFDSLTQECILNAYRNYINFKTGKMSRSDLDTSTNFLSLPVFNVWKNYLISKFNLVKEKIVK